MQATIAARPAGKSGGLFKMKRWSAWIMLRALFDLTSALDLSVRAEILNLLNTSRVAHGMPCCW
jgi:hypothetical protein